MRPTRELAEQIDALERDQALAEDYRAFMGDPQKLKAADWENNFGTFRMFDCCPLCGLYQASWLWYQPDLHYFKFYCHSAWANLDPQDPCYIAMAKIYGEHNGGTCPKGWMSRYGEPSVQESNWPNDGCGGRFYPWKRGASKVIEVDKPSGEPICFLAERPVAIMDDCIKANQEAFYKALNACTPEEILRAIPVTHPKRYLLDKSIPGIAQFPRVEWLKKNKPVLTAVGWQVLCEIVRRREPQLLSALAGVLDPSTSTMALNELPEYAAALDFAGKAEEDK